MIRLVEALSYRALRYARQSLAPFETLVGPNGSGKTTFLDIIDLLADLVADGPEQAIRERAPDLRQLTFRGAETRFEVAVEMAIPGPRRERLPNGKASTCRYEVALGEMSDGSVGLLAETLWLKSEGPAADPMPALFPSPPTPPTTIVIAPGRRAPNGWKKIVSKVTDSGNDYFQSETSGWNNLFRLGPRKSALANLPEDEEKFPVATWVKRALLEGIQRIELVSDLMRDPSAPGSPRLFRPDGSNLPWVVETLAPERRQSWIDHVRTAIPEIENIRTIDRPEDRNRYLVIDYHGGFAVPSWLISDGTLRLLALTLLAYLPSDDQIFLIEEPENGIHPSNVETVYQSLSSAYDAQVLCATHSPVLLGLTPPEKILCFAKTESEGVAIVRGSEHPRLRDWKGEVDLGTLLASGVLG
jgi:predicted ATPase